MNAVQKAIEEVGGVAKAAQLCGVSGRAVYKWIASGCMPRTEFTGETDYAQRLAKASRGKVNPKDLLKQSSPANKQAA